MPFDQTITIINNSGKVISTSKHLVGIFKEAKAAYREKKGALKQEKGGGFRPGKGPFVEEHEEGSRLDDREYGFRGLGNARQPLFLAGGGRLSQDSGRHSGATSQSPHAHQPRRSSSVGGSSHHSKSRHSRHRPSQDSPRPPHPQLTERNLRTHSEVSSTAPSSLPPRRLLPAADQSDMQPRALVRAQTTPAAPESAAPQTAVVVARPRSDAALRDCGSDQLDMHLAYGDLPPDLDAYSDADAGAAKSEDEEQKKAKAKTLIDYIEALLDEAECIHHTAASIIARLQDSPEAAAAVALTLAELSALLAKLSPAFLGIIKGGSPAVFALLASPQFLIGTSIAVGITVVAFGGWKIVKRMTDGKQAFEAAGSSPEQQQPSRPPAGPPAGPSLAGVQMHSLPPAVDRTAPTVVSDGFDEAVVLEEELSSIESWRRGIVPPGDFENGAVDAELISPQAMRSRNGDDDARSSRTHHSSRSRTDTSSQRSSHSHHRSKRHEDQGHGKAGAKDAGKSSRGSVAGAASVVSSHRSRRSESRAVERFKPGSTVSASSASSSPSADLGTSRSKDKKESSSGNMLKQLFKKKRDKEDKNRQDSHGSVLVR